MVILSVRLIRVVLKSESMVFIVSFEVISEFERHYKPQCLAEMDVCMDCSYKWRAECFYGSLVIIHTEHLSHGSSRLHILQKFPYFQISWGSVHS